MSEYYFYSKTESSKEPIVKARARSLADAISFFAKTKCMTDEVFLTLFGVEAVD